MEEVASSGYWRRTEISKVAVLIRPKRVEGRRFADPVFGQVWDYSDKLRREREEGSELCDGSGGRTAAVIVAIVVASVVGGPVFAVRRVVNCSHSLWSWGRR